MVFDKLIQIWKAKDLRKNILFVLAMLVIFRIAAHIPIPGVNPEALRSFFDNNQILGLLNVFSGGSMQNFSIVMMGIAPYITASIIFQLLGMIIPKLEEMQKEESGRQKINMWTRWLTVPMAAMQSFGMITILRRGSADILGNISQIELLSMIVIITLLTIVGVVYITEGQRNIPVQYAKQIRGNRIYGGTSTHLPLRVNMAGVISIFFFFLVVFFPSLIAQFFIHAKTQWIQTLAEWVMTLFQNQLFYGVLYFILVFAFTYFYTEVIFHPNQIAENLQKQGGFIPGIRPGKNTAEYLANTTHKIIFVGALFLGIIAILPLIMKYFTGMQSLAIGGTSLLIAVAVVVETVKQIESQLTMREYEGM